MNIIQIRKVKFSLIIISFSVISCSNFEQNVEINYQDTLELLNLSLGGKQFDDFCRDAGVSNKTVYIALDSVGEKWPERTGEIQIKTINEFHKKPEYDYPATESRLIIASPIFTFKKDSAIVSIYFFRFHLTNEFEFARDKGKWLLIGHKERQF